MRLEEEEIIFIILIITIKEGLNIIFSFLIIIIII